LPPPPLPPLPLPPLPPLLLRRRSAQFGSVPIVTPPPPPRLTTVAVRSLRHGSGWPRAPPRRRARRRPAAPGRALTLLVAPGRRVSAAPAARRIADLAAVADIVPASVRGTARGYWRLASARHRRPPLARAGALACHPPRRADRRYRRPAAVLLV
jgi:hypothetical protein